MDVPAIQRVLIVGAGTSGQQIAVQFARFNYDAVVHDIDHARLDACRKRQQELVHKLVADNIVQPSQSPEILSRMTYTTDPQQAAHGADLLSECVPESLELKRAVFAKFHPLSKPEAIFTTNTSYLFPSSMAAASGRPDRFAAFHFHVPVWHANAVDIMPHSRTSPEVVEMLWHLAWRVGQVPIRSKRENPGYVFNAILHPLLLFALDLTARGVADFEDVDRAWMAVTKMPIGPFGIVDRIGLDTIHTILEHWGRWLPGSQAKRATALLKTYLDRHRCGEKCGRGFYRYPRAAFQEPGFLSRNDAADSHEPKTKNVAERFVPRAVPTGIDRSFPQEVQFTHGAVLLGGDETADCLEQRLRNNGVDVARVPSSLAADQAGPWLDGQWTTTPRPHLFLVADRRQEDVGDGAGQVEAWHARHIELPFCVAQAWFRLMNQADLTGPATVLGICRIGGTFGFENGIWRAEDGALAGLVKAVAVESMVRSQPGVAAKVVDFDFEASPEHCVETALRELAAARSQIVTGEIDECMQRHATIEVGYVGRQRRIVRLQPSPDDNAADGDHQPSGVWLVSGGTSGITMQVALALSRRYGLRLHVLGRTALPDTDYLSLTTEELGRLRKDVMRSAYRRGEKPNEAWHPYARAIEIQQSLREYRRAGVPVAYHACDVSDIDKLGRVVGEIHETEQAVNGILHGAGVEQSLRLESKKTDRDRATLRPKTLGTRALIQVTAQDPLRWFIAFGSLSGRFGSAGQADYAMANEHMAKQVTALREHRPECRCVTIHWPGWDDVGMAARPENRYMLRKASHHLIPVSEGIDHTLREIELGAPHPEVVFVAPQELRPEMLAEHDSRTGAVSALRTEPNAL